MSQSTTAVTKLIPLQLDLGNLAAFDLGPLPWDPKTKLNDTDTNTQLSNLTRDNLQLLLNDIFKLPTKSSDVGPLVDLPKPCTVLPREKPAPKAGDNLTRWEKFAKAKGIQKRKRSAKEFDEPTQEWIPRHGAKSKKNRKDDMSDWCTEVK